MQPNPPVQFIRCSGLARPMACPGFLFLKDLPPSETNAAAEEGTAAGEMFRAMLEQKTLTPTLGLQASNGVYFNDDMRFYLKPIAEEILNRATPVLCETRIDWMTRSTIQIKGSYDVSFVQDDVLFIDDLKYGWGIVDVKRNWQLIGYAIGECIRRQSAFRGVMFRIHQPRPHHEEGTTRNWFVTYAELLALKEEIEVKLEAVCNGDAPLVTGNHCKYCAAAAINCPALNRSFYASINYVMNSFTQDSMSEAEVAAHVKLIKRVEEVMKVKLDSLTALAVNRINSGKVIPGFAMEKNFGHRSWAPGVSPAVIEAFTGRNITETSIISPAKAEKIGVSKELIKSLTIRPFIGNKLVATDNNALGDKIFGTQSPT